MGSMHPVFDRVIVINIVCIIHSILQNIWIILMLQYLYIWHCAADRITEETSRCAAKFSQC